VTPFAPLALAAFLKAAHITERAADRRSAWLHRVCVVSIAGALFESLRQFHVSGSDFVQLLPSVRVVEGPASARV